MGSPLMFTLIGRWPRKISRALHSHRCQHGISPSMRDTPTVTWVLIPCKLITGYTTVLPRGPYWAARGALIASSAAPTHSESGSPRRGRRASSNFRTTLILNSWGLREGPKAPCSLQNQLLCVQRPQHREMSCSGSTEENPPGKCPAWDQHPSHTARLHTQTRHKCARSEAGENWVIRLPAVLVGVSCCEPSTALTSGRRRAGQEWGGLTIKSAGHLC